MILLKFEFFFKSDIRKDVRFLFEKDVTIEMESGDVRIHRYCFL